MKKKQAKRRRKEEEKEEEIEVEVDVDDDEVEEEEEPIWLSSEIDVSPEGAKAEEPKKSGTAAPPSSSAATCGLQTMKSDGRLDVPFFSQFKPEDYADSRCAARDLFQMLISPVTHEQFYRFVSLCGEWCFTVCACVYNYVCMCVCMCVCSNSYILISAIGPLILHIINFIY